MNMQTIVSSLAVAATAALSFSTSAAASPAQQFDIAGPAGSVSFGATVTVLPSGNIVVTDPDGPVSGVGAVYLYSPGGTMLSSITGSSANDHVGSGGITMLKNGNFVILSPHWHNQDVADAGAVTWGDGTLGVSGVVSTENSFVGGTQGDAVGTAGSVTALGNGNYVIATPTWTNPGATMVTPTPEANAGAATLGNGQGGSTGEISSANSLVGLQQDDSIGIGGVTALPNGNYLVDSYVWNNGAVADAGAVTFGDGVAGVVGAVSAANSLVGSNADDLVGASAISSGPPYLGTPGVTALPNSNYVVVSYHWANGAASEAGAASFASGSTGLSGAITAANSLVGARAQDHIGSGGVAVLSNGNYVVDSPDCANVSATKAGAVTWADGSAGLAGVVSASNSLVGIQANDAVGGGTLIGSPDHHHVTALADGNYVVISSAWSNGATSNVGAVTWVDGSQAQPSVVSAADSLIGTTSGDQAGASGVVGAPNGDYVVASMFWSNGATSNAGAATFLHGKHRTSASISTANSLVGSSTNDFVGLPGAVALSNGNFVVPSEAWHNAGMMVGAVTWLDPNGNTTGPVTTSNSLTGSADGDEVGVPAALSNGNYVVSSGFWAGVGEATWGDGATGIAGPVSAANSLVGSHAGDSVGYRTAIALPDGRYILENVAWSNGSVQNAGAITLGESDGSTIGPVTSANSVLGDVADAGITLVHDYDATRGTLIVGKPAENIVTLFTYITDRIFANGFE